MASLSSISSERNENVHEFMVHPEQEAKLMIRYTKVFTRELIFAVDMMTFVMEDSNLHFENYIYPNCLGRPCPSDFDDLMKTFVSLTMCKYKNRALSLIERLLNLDVPKYEEFKCFANAATSKLHDTDYGEYAYLIYCVMMAQMCTIACLHGLTKAPDFGIMLMCRTHTHFLEKYVLPVNPWEKIRAAAREAVEMAIIEEKVAQ